MTKTDPQLLVFDWDGTLMDSQAHIVASLRFAIDALGAEARDEDALKDIIGLGMREAVVGLYPDADEAFVRHFSERYREHFLTDDDPSRFFPGAEETLHTLRDAGYRLGIATGKSRRGLDLVLRRLGLEDRFDSTRCADETRSKPDPLMLVEVMAEVGVEPRRTVMIGDTEYDMQLANNAGAGAVAVSHGVHALERLLRHDPLVHVDSIPELAAWLGVPAREPAARAGG